MEFQIPQASSSHIAELDHFKGYDALHIFEDLSGSMIEMLNEVTLSNPSNWLSDSLVKRNDITQVMLNFEYMYILILRVVEQ